MNAEDRLFGEIAIKLGFVERAELGGFVPALQKRPGEFGSILTEAGRLSLEQVRVVEAHQRRILQKRSGAAAPVPNAPAMAPANAPAALELTLDPAEPRARHSVRPGPQKEAARRPLSDRALLDSEPAPLELEGPAPYSGRQGTLELDEGSSLAVVLKSAAAQHASDLHVHAGAPLLVRIAGALKPLGGGRVVSAEETEKLIAEALSPVEWEALAEHGQIDFAYTLDGIGRFRVNAYRQQRGMDIVFRLIPPTVPSLADLGLPETLSKLTDFRTGLVLCTGPAGSGKSTTLAALVDALIRSRKEHVITLENPVEHVYSSAGSWVNQRQVHTHTESFARALRAALREDPDVIVISELRDRESIGLALSAAETGHLVLGTLNTQDAGQTIGRIVNAFPGDEQGHVRSMLSESLRAVISQRLVPTQDGKGRVPAVEILIATTAVANLIRDNKTFQLPSIMQTGSALGMVMLDNSLMQLVQSGKVTKEAAARFATARERFK